MALAHRCMRLAAPVRPAAVRLPQPVVVAAAAPLLRRFWSASEPAWKAHYKPLTLQPVEPYVPRTVPAHILRPPYAVPGHVDGQAERAPTDQLRSSVRLSGGCIEPQ